MNKTPSPTHANYISGSKSPKDNLPLAGFPKIQGFAITE